MDEARFRAVLIFIASYLSAFQRSSRSEPELFALSSGVFSPSVFSTYCSDDRFPALLGSRSRKGELSESEERLVRVGGNGEPSVRLARNPVLNRFCFGLFSNDGLGGAMIGESFFKSELT